MTSIVMGVGSSDRGDDRVGLEVARRLHSLELPGVEVVLGAEPASILELPPADALIVVDAVRTGRPPGSVVVIDAATQPLPFQAEATSTHALGLDAAIELARALDRLPSRVVIVGIEAADLRLGAPLSKPARRAIDDAVAAVIDVLSQVVTR